MNDISERIDISATDEPINASAWRNLYFAKDGRSFLCSQTYSSETDAAAFVDDFQPQQPTYTGSGQAEYNTIESVAAAKPYNPTTDWWPHEHSHTIQIPWRAA
jgi:hypothetical protein